MVVETTQEEYAVIRAARERFRPFVPRDLLRALLVEQGAEPCEGLDEVLSEVADCIRKQEEQKGRDSKEAREIALEAVRPFDAKDVLDEDVDRVGFSFVHQWLCTLTEARELSDVAGPIRLGAFLRPSGDGLEEEVSEAAGVFIETMLYPVLSSDRVGRLLIAFTANVRREMDATTERIPLNLQVTLVVENGAFSLELRQSA